MEDKVKHYLETAGSILVVISTLAILYSIVAGIWGYAPIEHLNLKIFGTGFIFVFIGAGIINISEEL